MSSSGCHPRNPSGAEIAESLSDVLSACVNSGPLHAAPDQPTRPALLLAAHGAATDLLLAILSNAEKRVQNAAALPLARGIFSWQPQR